MNKQITDLTEIELKALAYDELNKLQLAQNNLRVLNEELFKRQQAQQPQQAPLVPAEQIV